MFPGDYIELFGIGDATLFTNNLNRFLESREGLLGIAFASDDVAAADRALRRAGVVPGELRDLKRILEDPEGEVWPRFKLLHRSEEHTSELQSLMRISYAVFCLKKKQTNLIQQKTDKQYQQTNNKN